MLQFLPSCSSCAHQGCLPRRPRSCLHHYVLADRTMRPALLGFWLPRRVTVIRGRPSAVSHCQGQCHCPDEAHFPSSPVQRELFTVNPGPGHIRLLGAPRLPLGGSSVFLSGWNGIAGPELGSSCREPPSVSMWVQGPKYWSFPLLLFQCIDRKLDQKRSSQDKNRCPDGMAHCRQSAGPWK